MSDRPGPGRLRYDRTVVIGFVLLGALLSCQSDEAGRATPESGGVLRIGVEEPLGFLTPVEPMGRTAEEFLDHITPPLGWVDTQGRVRLRAARQWRQNENIWDFFLPDLVWEDGAALRPEDFALTYRACLDPAARARWSGRFDFVRDVRALDDTTLRITWNHLPPNRQRAAMLHPLPTHRLGQHPEVRDFREWDITRKPLACGPFRVVRSSGSILDLVRNDTWRRTPAYLDSVHVLWSREQEAIEGFRRGNLDVVDDVSAPGVLALRDIADKHTFAVVGRSYVFLGWNLSDTRARELVVRKAAAQAVDVTELIDMLTLGQGEPSRGPLLPIQGFADTSQVLGFDPDAARRALQQAGWGDANQNGLLDRRGINLHFEILVDENKAMHVAIADRVAQQFRAVGIGCSVQPLMTIPFLERLDAGRFEAFIGQWYPDVDANVESVWRHDGFLNYSGYDNAHADSLMLALRYELQPQARELLLQDLQRTIYGDQPYLFLLQPPRFTVVAGRVQGADPNLLSTFWNLPQWWIPRRLQ